MPFNINYSASYESSFINFIAKSLDQSLDSLVSNYSFEYPNSNIDISVYSSSEFSDIHKAPNWAGAIYDGKIRLPLSKSSSKTK